MKRLYNESSVLNEDGQAFSSLVRALLTGKMKLGFEQSMIDALCTNDDLDLRDAQLATLHEVNVLFSEAILKRAAKERRKIRIAKSAASRQEEILAETGGDVEIVPDEEDS